MINMPAFTNAAKFILFYSYFANVYKRGKVYVGEHPCCLDISPVFVQTRERNFPTLDSPAFTINAVESFRRL